MTELSEFQFPTGDGSETFIVKDNSGTKSSHLHDISDVDGLSSSLRDIGGELDKKVEKGERGSVTLAMIDSDDVEDDSVSDQLKLITARAVCHSFYPLCIHIGYYSDVIGLYPNVISKGFRIDEITGYILLNIAFNGVTSSRSLTLQVVNVKQNPIDILGESLITVPAGNSLQLVMLPVDTAPVGSTLVRVMIADLSVPELKSATCTTWGVFHAYTL